MLPLRKLLFIQWLLLTLAMSATRISTSNPMVKPGCPTHCGNITVPYPFGIGLDRACNIGSGYTILCDTTFNPPKLFYLNMEIVDISLDGQMRIKNNVAVACYGGGKLISSVTTGVSLDLIDTPFLLSDTANKLTLIGCEDRATLLSGNENISSVTGCASSCGQPSDMINGSCTGTGCCQTSIFKKFKRFAATLDSFDNHTSVSYFNPCSYAFVAEEGKYIFNVADLSDSNFVARTIEKVPIVLEWVVGGNETCYEARKNSSSYACQKNSNCTDLGNGVRGYRCSCLPGFEGNPYLTLGCTDSDECKGASNPCTHICTNNYGSYNCSCPKGLIGDGLKNGRGCARDQSKFITKFTLGLTMGFVSLLATVFLTYFTIKKRKLMKMRAKFFKENGGLLLKQQLPPNGGNRESCTIFCEDELSAATNHFGKNNILGEGGYGTVYKGILKDGREVAIKKSNNDNVNQNQIEQFINEVVILSQINHRNVVKLLGCCLETQVPLLVYEFIKHGTLYEQLHEKKGQYWLSWSNCVRLAAEAADALSYLYSAASVPIIHRDVKSANILIDDRYTARISDFGASRFVPNDQTWVSTAVIGTYGYLDPEYHQTGQLTGKSDVYSFGVVLAEILTKKQPIILTERETEGRRLASYFVSSINQDQLFRIIDPELIKEASEEHLVAMANLITKCLNEKGEDRPTMRDVAIELEALKNQITHPWDDKNYHEIESLKGEQDLYPVF